MNKIHDCVSELVMFFEYVINEDWDKAQDVHEKIMKLEAEADELKKEIRLHMPNSLFLPVARGDLLGLLTSQDKIASKAKHITSVIVTRQTHFPESIVKKYSKFVSKSVETSLLARNAIDELDELVEVGFKGKEVKIVEKMILKLDKLERETDEMQVKLRYRLFKIEKQLDPIDVIFLYKIIDWTAELADRAQHVGHRLESLIAR